MEQSRLVYENATNQLGSFLEMVSTKLTNTKVGDEADPEADGRMSRRRSRTSDKMQRTADKMLLSVVLSTSGTAEQD